MMNRIFFTPLAAMVLLLTGCARYEYDLVNPPDLARHIGSKADEIVRVDPLEYRLRSYDNRLTMSIFNPTHDPITLAGDHSYVVTQTIAPGTYVRVILPPMRPGYYESSPSIGIGLGVGYVGGFRGRRPYPFYDPYFYDEPRYYTYYDESDTTYWNWEGETAVKLHLVYQRAQTTFSHDFTFHRKNM